MLIYTSWRAGILNNFLVIVNCISNSSTGKWKSLSHQKERKESWQTSVSTETLKTMSCKTNTQLSSTAVAQIKSTIHCGSNKILSNRYLVCRHSQTSLSWCISSSISERAVESSEARNSRSHCSSTKPCWKAHQLEGKPFSLQGIVKYNLGTPGLLMCKGVYEMWDSELQVS